MTNPFRGRGPFRYRGPFRAHGPFRGLGPFGRPDASLRQTVWHFAQDTYDADPAPVGIKTLVTAAIAQTLGITNAQSTSNAPMVVTGRDGTLQYAAHNLFLNSAAPATQTITVVSGVQYTIWGTGTGSVVLSSGGSGTLTLSGATNSLTFTTSGTSLVCTVSGPPTFVQVNRGPTALDAVTTTGSIVYAPPISYERGATAQLLTNSQDFGSWTQNNCSIVSASTGLAIQETGAAGAVHRIWQTAGGSVVSGMTYCFWADVIPGARRYLQLAPGGTAFATASACFDLQSLVVSAKAASVVSAGLIPQGNGIYRCFVTIPAASSAAPDMYINPCAANDTPTYDGVAGTNAVYLLRAQLTPGTSCAAYLRSFATAPLYASSTPKAQNLATGSATQTITGLMIGCVYTVVHQAGGTYTLSGAGSGTTTAGVATRVVATTTSLTLTASSAPTLLQVYEGTADLAYVAGPYNEYPQAGRYDDAVGSTNSIANSSMTGAAAGSPGTDPTNWSISANGNGLTKQIVATGTIDGRPYIDVRFSGTTSNTNGITLKMEALSGIAAANGQTWSVAADVALIAGSMANTSGLQLAADMMSSVPAYLASLTSNAKTLFPYLVRLSYSPTLNNASTAYVVPYLYVIPTGAGQAVDFTLRIAVPQLEQRAVATPWIPTTNAAATRSPTLIRYPNAYLTDGPQTVASCFVAASVAPTNQALLARGPNGEAIYLNGSGARSYDGTNAPQVVGVVAGVPQIIAARWSGAGMGVSLNGSAIATTAFDGTMGSGTVGSGDDGTGSLGFTGLRKWDKSAPRTFNDTDFAKASAGII